MAPAKEARLPRLNSFQAYSRSLRAQLAADPSVSPKSITAIVTARWQALSVEDKENWREQVRRVISGRPLTLQACILSGVAFVPKPTPTPSRPIGVGVGTGGAPLARPVEIVPSSSHRREWTATPEGDHMSGVDTLPSPLDILAHTAESRRREPMAEHYVLRPPPPSAAKPYAWAPAVPSWGQAITPPPMILPHPSVFEPAPLPIYSTPIAPPAYSPPPLYPTPDSPADRRYRVARSWQLETLDYLRNAAPETQRQASTSPDFYVSPRAAIELTLRRSSTPRRPTLYDSVLDDL